VTENFKKNYAAFTIQDLDHEQQELLEYLTKGGINVVSGPPGSGKTLLAYLLAEKVQQQYTEDDYPPLSNMPLTSLIMQNKVLKSFVYQDIEKNSSAVVKNNFFIDHTSYNFLKRMWRNSFCTCYKGDFFKKDLPKCRCRNSKFPHDTSYSGWVNYQTYLGKLMEQSSETKDRFHFGHLVVDEGQDFPSEFFQTLFMISSVWADRPYKLPSITVFADENQTIQDENSTINQILNSLALPREKLKRLKRNYRNTKQIYDFASHFKVKPQETTAPTREGAKPKVVIAQSQEYCVDYVTEMIKNNQDKSFLLVIGQRAGRQLIKTYLGQLEILLDRTDVEVAAYFNVGGGEGWMRRSVATPAEDLIFGSGHVNVIFDVSSKGTQADVVIYCGLEQYDVNVDSTIKNRIYVNSTRTFEELYFILDDDSQMSKWNEIKAIFPNKELGFFDLEKI